MFSNNSEARHERVNPALTWATHPQRSGVFRNIRKQARKAHMMVYDQPAPEMITGS